MATGIAVGGFGSGALVYVPLASWLMAQYRELPTLLGMKDEVALTQEAGARWRRWEASCRRSSSRPPSRSR